MPLLWWFQHLPFQHEEPALAAGDAASIATESAANIVFILFLLLRLFKSGHLGHNHNRNQKHNGNGKRDPCDGF